MQETCCRFPVYRDDANTVLLLMFLHKIASPVCGGDAISVASMTSGQGCFPVCGGDANKPLFIWKEELLPPRVRGDATQIHRLHTQVLLLPRMWG